MVTLSITVDDELDRDLSAAVAGAGEDRSVVVATAIREYLDRRNIAAAAAWHASLTGDDAATLAEFDAAW
jgi:predicted transcriptional regulator